jgi:hypothetical protein
MALDCLRGYLEILKETGRPLPKSEPPPRSHRERLTVRLEAG